MKVWQRKMHHMLQEVSSFKSSAFKRTTNFNYFKSQKIKRIDVTVKYKKMLTFCIPCLEKIFKTTLAVTRSRWLSVMALSNGIAPQISQKNAKDVGYSLPLQKLSGNLAQTNSPLSLGFQKTCFFTGIFWNA